jgi:ribosomal protein S6
VEDINRCGGVVREFRNLGLRPLAYRMRSHHVWHEDGQYLRIYFQGSAKAKDLFYERLRNDDQVVRHFAFRHDNLAPKRPPAAKPLPPPKMDAAEADFIRMATGGQFDYVAARWLVRNGLITKEQLALFPKRYNDNVKTTGIADAQALIDEANNASAGAASAGAPPS